MDLPDREVGVLVSSRQASTQKVGVDPDEGDSV
jgi:hypothetical protein